MSKDPQALPPLPLPSDITEHYIDCTSTVGLTFHILTAGYSRAHSRPLILLLHGFPELAFSWRKIMPTLAEAGYCVVALDHRGYGRTVDSSGRAGDPSGDFHATNLSRFSMTSIVADSVALVHAIGYRRVHCVVGHDFGAASAAACALMRPDFFRSVVLMSHPFKGSPELPFDILFRPTPSKDALDDEAQEPDVHTALARLSPPRKHYKWYNSTPPAAHDWEHPTQGLHAFLRGYFHLKSADWAGNAPYPLKAWTAQELAKMPHYYIMPLDASMPQAVAGAMASEDTAAIALSTRWLSDEELDVYVREWSRTGFQGALNFYRIATDPANTRDLLLFGGKKIEAPCTFVSGELDWGNFQEPGVVENMPNVCADYRGTVYIPGASHWVQQEQPEATVEAILGFLRGLVVR